MRKRFFILAILVSLLTAPLVLGQESSSTGEDIKAAAVFIWGWLAEFVRIFLFGFSYAVGMSDAEAAAVITALIVFLYMLLEMKTIFYDFTSFSKGTSWVIALGLMIVIGTMGIVRALANGIWGIAKAVASKLAFMSAGNALAVVALLLITLAYFVIRYVTDFFGASVIEKKRRMKKIEEEAGSKILQNIGKTVSK